MGNNDYGNNNYQPYRPEDNNNYNNNYQPYRPENNFNEYEQNQPFDMNNYNNGYNGSQGNYNNDYNNPYNAPYNTPYNAPYNNNPYDNGYGYNNGFGNNDFNNNQGRNGMAIASMVVGIIFTTICCWSGPFTLIPSVIGLIFGIISIKQKRGGKGFAIAGIILCSIGILFGIWITSLVINGNLNSEDENRGGYSEHFDT